jgi:hypothetical protein
MADVAAAFMRLRQAYESTFQIPFSQAVVALQRQQRSAQHRESNDDLSQRFPHPVKPSTAKKSSSAKQSLPIDKQQHRLFVVLTTSGLNNVEDYSLVRAHCKRNGWQFVKAFTDLSTRPVTHLIVQPAGKYHFQTIHSALMFYICRIRYGSQTDNEILASVVI